MNNRPFTIGIRLSKEEKSALEFWANLEGLDKSTLLRHVFRQGLRDAAKAKIVPARLVKNLVLQQPDEQCL